jgi:hypothetical protein
MTQKIPLSQGKHALVDDEDFDRISQWKWHFSDGYAARHSEGSRPVRMHREIMQPSDGLEVDHIDGNKLNNCRSNLRLATHGQNMRNRKLQTGGTSQYKGVVWYAQTSRWQAKIQVDRKTIHLGYFADEIDAARAYDKAACTHFGEFARLNFEEQ